MTPNFPALKTKKSRGCLIPIAVASALGIVGLVGLAVAGMALLVADVETAVQDNPVLLRHMGAFELELDWSRSMAAEEQDVFVFRVKGTKGEGRLIARTLTLDDGGEAVLSGALRLASGETIDILAAAVDGTEPGPASGDAVPLEPSKASNRRRIPIIR